MKLSHAAALALVGWYLILPPMGSRGIDDSALAKWTVYQDYDSLRECAAAKIELNERVGNHDPDIDPSLQFSPLQFPRRLLGQFAQADCVASDDPRLKAK